ncbi:Adenine-specific DNA methylase, N12 class [Leucobacter chromiiresistens]|uniref:Adenine-specific DNA methylase, N12 class n=1 Tax=Leucobacter chromiiresistens TaxID=1079994 RepID=A0A1H0YIU9_9MICO|nr:Adenine-specific DNA methylase, N12 class [Leucobacter chromiiresistens]
MRRFPGWGATPELFDPNSNKYAADREALQEMWGDTEWGAARRTVLNAHYTHPDYVRAMWDAADRLGVSADAQVLEPGCGTGNFIGQARPGQQVTGVELDPTTAGVARLLHPGATVRNESFGDTFLDHDGYDLTIGNVPFGQTKLYDPAYNEAKLSLHNHFIVKSLRQTKPGGIVMVMSSRWTMDGKTERARREIAKYGELLGAVRMPRGAHGEIAGTDATIDVLVFRRHLGEAPESEPAWLRAVDVDGAAGAAAINSYFEDHPEMVLGELGTRLGQFGPELTVTAADVSAAAVAPALRRSLDRIVDDAIANGQAWEATGKVVADRPVARIVQDPDQVIGHIGFDEETGLLTQVGLDGPEPVTVPKNAVAELQHLVRLRDAAVRVLEAEASTREDTPEIGRHRAALNGVYDRYVEKYGPVNRVSVTVKERVGKDPSIIRRYPAAVRALRQDPHFATVVALERYNEDTGEARKATVFTERVVGAVTEVHRVDSPEDAIRVSLDRIGHVDVPLVSELLDVDEASVPERLGDLVFLNPDDLETYIPAGEFLSGNVRQKRKEMRELAAADAMFQRHLDALEQVIPEEVGPAEIDVKFGAGWVPVDDVSMFLEHELKKEVKAIERIDGEWKYALVGKPAATAESRWGVSGDHVNLTATDVFKRVLNGKSLEVTYRPDKDGPMFVDQVATETLQERAGELHESFQDWLWQDGERVERLQERYNDLYNGIVLRSYDGVELTFPGKAATFEPRPHQHAAVARMLAEPATGLFHEVGAGKTAEMVLGVKELKRLGMVNKPAIIVPNQMLEQFTREYKQIYPRAKVLAAGSEDIQSSGTKNGRKLFVARARTGDWDAVILTHSAFERIGLGKAQEAYAAQRLHEMQEIHEAKLNSQLSEKSVKGLEKALADQEQLLKRMLDIGHDEGVSWEETGIDYLCIDEAHKFKNLTVISKVADLSKPAGSKRATDLDMKLWYYREHLGQSRVATLATATPLPNSMIEMYVMMRYMRPDLLREAQVYTADDWARQFTEQVTAVEAKPDGGGFQVKTRTTKFRNVPELLRMWHVPGDVKTQADLALPVPELVINCDGKRAPEMIVVPATRAQEAGMADLIVRGEAVRNGAVEPTEDNMLKITANGRALAMDARLMDEPGPEDDERTKLDVVAEQVFRIWDENKDREYLDEWGEISSTPGALQIVFADLGTPAADGRWDAYNELRDQLVARGVPASQVRFIHEASNDQAKAELFQQARDGRVQVLVGSTEKMGVGTNVQARAIALHHVDAPWRPADVTQREGREIRQGNQNPEVHLLRYATEGSFDSYMWGTLARKAAFIEQVLTGRLDVREVDNSTEMALQFAEMQAITAGDMRILEVANLRNETQKLARQQRGHQRKIGAIEVRQKMLEQQVGVFEHDLQVLRALAPKVVETRGDAFSGRVKPSSWAESPMYRDRKEFGAAFRTTLERARAAVPYFGTNNAGYPAPLKFTVSVGGLDWEARLRWNPKASNDPIVEFHAGRTIHALQYKMLWSRAMDGEVSMVSQGFESHARMVPDEICQHEDVLVSARGEVRELEVMSAEKWPRKDELDQKQMRLAAIITELEREAAGPKDNAPAPPQHTVERTVSSGHTM